MTNYFATNDASNWPYARSRQNIVGVDSTPGNLSFPGKMPSKDKEGSYSTRVVEDKERQESLRCTIHTTTGSGSIHDNRVLPE